MFTQLLTTAGEKPFTFSAGALKMEGIVTVPEIVHPQLVAVLGHPHSLQGGSMNNKVVTTLARACKELGIPSVRFNFRQVGNSQGQFDNGIGESEDMLILSRLWQTEYPQCRFIFAGFSFGSYVAYRTAAHMAHELLISVAPPVHHYDYKALQPTPAPWCILQGETDEVVPSRLVIDFTQQMALPLTLFPHTGHFFHGQLLPLKAAVINIINEQVLA